MITAFEAFLDALGPGNNLKTGFGSLQILTRPHTGRQPLQRHQRPGTLLNSVNLVNQTR